jgi:hypothetical protein
MPVREEPDTLEAFTAPDLSGPGSDIFTPPEVKKRKEELKAALRASVEDFAFDYIRQVLAKIRKPSDTLRAGVSKLVQLVPSVPTTDLPGAVTRLSKAVVADLNGFFDQIVEDHVNDSLDPRVVAAEVLSRSEVITDIQGRCSTKVLES